MQFWLTFGGRGDMDRIGGFDDIAESRRLFETGLQHGGSDADTRYERTEVACG
jgi:hypothetical protein